MKIFDPFLDGNCNVHTQLWDHLRAKTFRALRQGTREKEALADAGAVQQRGERIRAAFLESIGGLPPADTPLNARTVGILARPGYHIEKVIFESQPGVYVTALLYLPDVLDLPAPGILFVCGHGKEAKAYTQYQLVCHDLALNGFVALAIDPTGQGERITTLDPETGKMSHGWGTTEHSYQGQQCILTGTNIARYFLHDALRAVDYLQSRPEVDPERIGITGNSGGGTQTSLVCMSGDPRIKVAVPCTYVTSREHYWLTGQPQDAEQLQFGMTANGINFDDMFYPFAPRPLLIGAVRSDFFSPEGTELTYNRLRRAYATLGRQDDVALAWAPGGHMYHQDLREAAVNWFRRHLLGAAPDFKTAGDDAIETLPEEQLFCTRRGHVLSEFADARTPYHLNLERIPARPTASGPTELRRAVREALALPEGPADTSGLFPRIIRRQDSEGYAVESIYFISEPGIMVAGALVLPAGEPGEVLLCLADGGTDRFDDRWPRLREAAQAGAAAFLFDWRGAGAVKAHPVNPYGGAFGEAFFNTDAWFSWAAYCLGENLLGMRVYDTLRAVDYLHSRGFTSIGLRAEGITPALVGYLAGALDDRIQSARIDGLIESYEAWARNQFYRRDLLPTILVHGVLRRFDLPDLRTLYEGRTLEVTTIPVRERED